MNQVILIILAILLPPVSVYWKRGFGKDLVINVVLCVILFFPGMIHAVWVSTR